MPIIRSEWIYDDPVSWHGLPGWLIETDRQDNQDGEFQVMPRTRTFYARDGVRRERILNEGDLEENNSSEESAPVEYPLALIGLRNYSAKAPDFYPFKATKQQKKENKPLEQSGLLFLGVELEVRALNPEKKEESLICSEIERKVFKQFAICKPDSSTGTNGFEICTVPATYEVHKNVWNDFFEVAAPRLSDKFIGHPGEVSLGMHVHVSRAHFSTLQQGKLLVFYNHPTNRKLINAVAGRKRDRWSIAKADHKVTDVVFDRAGTNLDRYSAVNTTNEHTLEVRIFKSTVDRFTFMYRLEFVQASCEFVKQAVVSKLSTKDFISWLTKVKQRKRFPNLAQFIAERQNSAEGKLI